MKAIKLNKSPKIIKTPDFIDFPVLEELELKDCINLLALHPSIGVHKKLTLLNLKSCKNLKSLPRTLEMESLKILILSECSKVKSIPEFGENMKSVSKFYLDGTAITKLPKSIGNLTGLVLLNVKDCKNLMTLPSTFLNLSSLEKLNLSGCSKLLQILGATECLEGFDETGIAKKVKKLFISRVKRRSTNPLDLSITSLSSLCSLSKLETLDLSYCNLNAIPNAIGCLSTLEILILSGNNFGSFMQRSPNPLEMLLTSLSEGSCSLNKLDLSYCNLNGFSDKIGCLPSLEELILSGNKFGYLPDSIAQLSKLLSLELEDCLSLQSLPMLPLTGTSAEIPKFSGLGNGCRIDYYRKRRPRVVPKQDFIVDIYEDGGNEGHKRLVLGSEIPESFELQNMGTEINNIKLPSHLCDELVGIASCGLICCRQPVDIVQLDCYLICNGKIINLSLITELVPQDSSDWLFLVYYPRTYNNWKRYVVNGFTEFGIRYRAHGSDVEVKECGIHLVYEKGFERLPGLAYGDSDSDGSSEYDECGEELRDWEESRESDQDG